MSMGPGEWMVVIAVLLVLFGGKKIPEMARGPGQAQREFRKGLEDDGKNTGTSTALPPLHRPLRCESGPVASSTPRRCRRARRRRRRARRHRAHDGSVSGR